MVPSKSCGVVERRGRRLSWRKARELWCRRAGLALTQRGRETSGWKQLGPACDKGKTVPPARASGEVGDCGQDASDRDELTGRSGSYLVQSPIAYHDAYMGSTAPSAAAMTTPAAQKTRARRMTPTSSGSKSRTFIKDKVKPSAPVHATSHTPSLAEKLEARRLATLGRMEPAQETPQVREWLKTPQVREWLKSHVPADIGSSPRTAVDTPVVSRRILYDDDSDLSDLEEVMRTSGLDMME